jgi:hypothetical protein
LPRAQTLQDVMAIPATHLSCPAKFNKTHHNSSAYKYRHFDQCVSVFLFLCS